MRVFRQQPPIDWAEAQAALRAWYAGDTGRELHGRIASRIEYLLRSRYALHCLQLGGTRRGVDLLSGRGLIHRIHITGDGADSMRALPSQLPLASGSVDLVLLCHALEFSPDPHTLLREVDRVLALDGVVVCVGFDPWSLFGLRGLWHRGQVPWCGRFYGAGRVGDWFALLGWRMLSRERVASGPAVLPGGLRHRLAGLVSRRRLALLPGGVHLLVGRKHSIPFTPAHGLRLRTAQPVIGRTVRPTRYTETLQ